MGSYLCCAQPRPCRGFTLVEIMIVVTIIGLLATLAIPALTRVRQAAKNNRFVSDLRTFAQAFETYAMENGSWPANAGSGVVPAGMSGAIGAAWVAQNSLGGRWNWDRNFLGSIAAIATTSVTSSDAEMARIDAKIDDGDLGAGMFQKVSGRFVYLLEQ